MMLLVGGVIHHLGVPHEGSARKENTGPQDKIQAGKLKYGAVENAVNSTSPN